MKGLRGKTKKWYRLAVRFVEESKEESKEGLTVCAFFRWILTASFFLWHVAWQ